MAAAVVTTGLALAPVIFETAHKLAKNPKFREAVKGTATAVISAVNSADFKKISQVFKKGRGGSVRRRGFASVSDVNALCDKKNRRHLEVCKKRVLAVILMSEELRPDKYHAQLAKMDYPSGEYRDSDLNFWHIIYYCAHRITGVGECCNVCKTLDCDSNIDKYIDYISMNKEKITCLMVGYYGVSFSDMSVTTRLMKRCYNSKSGTRVFDLLLTLTDIFAGLDSRVFDIMGGVLFEESLSPWGPIISEAISSENRANTVSYILSTGNELSPVHWCGLFLDKQTKIAYCYNSLGNGMKEKSKLAKILGSDWRVLVNKTDQQTKSSLCGIYAIKFIKYMLGVESANREEMFVLSFDDMKDSKTGDAIMADEATNYINDGIKEHNPLGVPTLYDLPRRT